MAPAVWNSDMSDVSTCQFKGGCVQSCTCSIFVGIFNQINHNYILFYLPLATFSQCRSISLSRAMSICSSSTLHTNSAMLSRSPVNSLKRPKLMRKFTASSFESSWSDFTSHVNFHSTLVMCGKSNPVVKFLMRNDVLFFSYTLISSSVANSDIR